MAKRTNTAKGHRKGEPVRFVRGHVSDEIRERVAASKRGKPRDAATRSKISAALTGRSDPPAVRAGKRARAQRSDRSPVWVGTDASYNAVHNRARLVLTGDCAHADASCKGPLHAALRHDAPEKYMRVSPRGIRYFVGPRIEDGYQRLCASHHRRYDV